MDSDRFGRLLDKEGVYWEIVIGVGSSGVSSSLSFFL